MGINDDIRRSMLGHELALQRYTRGLVSDVIGMLNASDRDVVRALERRLAAIAARGYDTGPYTTRRLEALHQELQQLTYQQYKLIGRRLRKDLRGLAEAEVEFPGRAIAEALGAEYREGRFSYIRAAKGGLNVSFIRPGAAQLVALVEANPFQGSLLSEFVRDLADTRIFSIDKRVKIGFANGKGIPEIVRDVEGLGFDIDRRYLTTWTRTAVADVANSARDLMYEENADILRGVRWDTTFDSRTCEVCIAHGGHVYSIPDHAPLDGGPPWGAGPGRLHPQDRCTATPETKSFRELGLDIDEIPEQMRASQFGPVKGNQTPTDFMRDHPSVPRTIYGRDKAQLLLKGGLKAEDLISQDNVAYTLTQLRELHPGAFAKAGLEKAA